MCIIKNSFMYKIQQKKYTRWLVVLNNEWVEKSTFSSVIYTIL